MENDVAMNHPTCVIMWTAVELEAGKQRPAITPATTYLSVPPLLL